MSDIDILEWVLEEISRGNRVALLSILEKRVVDLEILEHSWLFLVLGLRGALLAVES